MELKGLKFLRKSFGMTMKELGEKLDVTPTTINLWEKGQMPITQERLYELNNFFMLDNPKILYHDFAEENLETSNLTLEVELARLQYKIKQYNELNANKIKSDYLLGKIDVAEENKELFEELIYSMNKLSSNLSPKEFKEIGSYVKYIIDGLVSKNKYLSQSIKLWIDVMRFDGVSKYGNNDYNKYSVEDYIKVDIQQKVNTLSSLNNWNEEQLEEEVNLDDFYFEY